VAGIRHGARLLRLLQHPVAFQHGMRRFSEKIQQGICSIARVVSSLFPGLLTALHNY